MASIKFGQNLVIVNRIWTDFESIVNSKVLSVQSETVIQSDNTHYEIFALDGLIVYRTRIFTGAVPSSTFDENGNILTQGVNDSNKAAFEARFLSRANNLTNQLQSFIVKTGGTPSGNAKSMLSLVNNTLAYKVSLRKIEIKIFAGTALSGDIDFRLYRITGHSGGTLVTPLPMETSDSRNTSITARVGSSVSGESTDFLNRWLRASANTNNAQQQDTPAYEQQPGFKPIILNTGEGVHLKCATITTAGTWEIVFYFTQG